MKSLFVTVASVLALSVAAVAQAQPFAYVANQSANSMSVIDTANNSVVATVPVGTGPRGVAVNALGTRVYVANLTSNDVSVINAVTNTVISAIPVGTSPRALAINSAGTRLYVSNSSTNDLSVIDTMTNTVIATVPVGLAPRGVAVNPAGTRVFVASASGNNVSVIDATNNTVLTTIGVGQNPFGVAINPAGTRLYVTNQNGNDVAVIDATNNTFLSGIIVGSVPQGIAINPAGTRAYVTNTSGGSVSVIDITNNTVLATVSVSSPSFGVGVNTAGTKVYVASGGTNSVAVIDAGTNTIITSVAVGVGPGGISVGPILAPGAPNLVSVTPGNGFATVAFTAPAGNGGAAITSYSAKSSPGNIIGTGTGSPVLVSGLANGTAYTFTVVATNSVGSGLPSAVSAAIVPAGTPSAPIIGSATAGNASASVSFTPPANNGSAITSYTVRALPGGPIVTGTTSPIMVSGLINGSAFTFTVTATNAIGTSPASAASNSVVPSVAPTVPGAPLAVFATASSASAIVSFTAPANNGGSPITGYTVISSPAGGLDTSAGTTALTHSITGLINGTAYTFTVVANNAVGQSTPSAPSNSVVPATGALAASQRAILTDLFTSTNGAAWTNKTNWNGAPGTECTWFGVICDATQSNVVAINLGGNNLVGTLPALSGLAALQTFNVFNNKLTGPIPSLTGLTALRSIDVSGNSAGGGNLLTGAIPSLTGLTNLRSFSANFNQLSGPIPSLTGLTNLSFFSAINNQLSGPIPSLTGLTALQIFQVSTNLLTGSIPSLTGLTALQFFQVASNQLTGPIPPLAGLTSLQSYFVDRNQLTGSIPALTGLTALQSFAVSTNQLTGAIPSLTGLTALQSFLFASNQLSGPIPSLTGLTALQNFNAFTNQLTGPIPSLNGLTALQTFSAGGNLLTGTIPSLSGLTNLTEFYVWGNQLTGTIPPLSGLTALRFFEVFNNQLSGALPSLSGLAALQRFYAFANQLTGPIPSLSGLTALKDFRVHLNNLNGAIPSVSGLTALQFFNVRNNQLTGPIPSLSGLTALQDFRVQSNLLTGAIPSLSGLPALLAFLVDNNQLTGAVPTPPATLTAGQSTLCTNSLTSSGVSATDTAWNTATGVNWQACQIGAAAPVCTLSASPTSVIAGGTATLTASCTPAATSFTWTGGTCVGTNATTCSVTLTATTTYTFRGTNVVGIGNTATATITIAPPAVSAVTLSPQFINFGARTVNTTSPPATVVLTNSGTGDLVISSIQGTGDFGFTSTCPISSAAVAPSASCAVNITFTPLTAVGLQGAITITSNAPGSPHRIQLSGTGTANAVAAITVSPTALVFGAQIINSTSAAQNVTIANTGFANLLLSNVVIEGPFSRLALSPSSSPADCASTVAPQSTCQFAIVFRPTTIGAQTGQITIPNNASETPLTISLSGSGTPIPVPVIKVSDAVVFGDQVINSVSTVRNLTISNTGAAPLVISAIRLAGNNANNFSVTGQSGCGSIAPEGSCTLSITFAPTTTGAKTAQIIFTSNAENAATVNATTLTGSGILAPRPLVSLSTSVIGFGNVIFGGATSSQIVILTNPGGQAMSIARIDVTGDFLQTNNCGTSLAALASCTINIGFAPLGTGPLSGEFVLTSTAATSPDRIQLGGTGCRWFNQSKSRLFLTVC